MVYNIIKGEAVVGIRNIKLLGGIGIGLSLFSWLPAVGILLSLVGTILIFIAFWRISKINPEKGIFKNVMLGYLFSFLGGFAVGILSSLVSHGSSFNAYLLILWILMGVFISVSGYFFKKALYETSETFNEKLFKTAGDVIFFGSLGTFVILGFFVVFIGWIIATIAFFKLPDELKEKLEN